MSHMEAGMENEMRNMVTFGSLPIGATFTRSGPAVYRKSSQFLASLVQSNGDQRALSSSGMDGAALVTEVALP